MVAYLLSRVDNWGEGTPIEDSFIDEHVFEISTHTLWYVDIANYLAIGKVPQNFPYKEQWKIIHHCTHYSLIE